MKEREENYELFAILRWDLVTFYISSILNFKQN
jgi:hypothetical protein